MPWLLENIMIIVWAAVIVGSIFIEATTMSLVAIWFIPSAVVSLILSLCGVGIGIQAGVWAVGSVLFLVFARRIFKKVFKVEPIATNADANIGEKAVVTSRIDNLASCGEAKVRGQMWTARSYDDSVTYEVGEVLTVLSIEGVKVICKK